MYQFWVFSDKPKANYDSFAGSDIIAYEGTKVLGFYTTNVDLNYVDDKIEVIITKSLEYHSMVTKEKAYRYFEESQGYLHIFQPINFPEKAGDGKLKLPETIIPAFYLKAFHDKNIWSNFERGTWLAIDIVTTATGVGNLLKFRHLVHLYKLGNVIKITLLGVEIASGTLGIMLALAEGDDTEWGRKLRTFLIYLDFATLGVDAISSVLLKKAAREAREAMPTSLIDTKDGKKVYDELNTIADTPGALSRAERKTQIEDIQNDLRQLELDASGNKRKAGDFTRHTNFSEWVSDEFFLNLSIYKGKNVKLTRISKIADNLDVPTTHGKGIDAVYLNELFKPPPPPPKYILNEVKYNTTGSKSWKPKLDKTITKSKGSQMQKKWIWYNLKNTYSKAQVKDIIRNGYDAVLTGISRDGKVKNKFLIQDDLAKKMVQW